MNHPSQNTSFYKSASGAGPENADDSAEATLRLIARLPVPDGLEDRVLDGLKKQPRRGRVLHWPSALRPGDGWIRSAAAAAIVFVVAGGGWGIYARVQPGSAAKVIVMPRAGTGGGFSNAGAMRTPQTLSLPVVVSPATGQLQPLKNDPAKVLPMASAQVKSNARVKASTQAATK